MKTAVHGLWSGYPRIFIFLFTVYCSLFTVHSYVHAQQQSQLQQKQQQPLQQGVPAKQRTLEEERLNILKADIQKEIANYKRLRQEIDEAQKVIDEKAKERLMKVVKMYEAIPSEEAARRLEKLDEDIAVSILTSLKPKTAGKILAQMENERAVSLSKRIIVKGKVPQEKTSQ
ncbi:MAG: hypothetical protein HY099_05965 [Nitrospirae bacterium]|nr:hypothetical protein [Nitrospirota bacterium]